MLQNSEMDVEIIAHTDQSKGVTKKKTQKVNKSGPCRPKQMSKKKMSNEKTAELSRSLCSVSEYDSNFLQLKSQLNVAVQSSELMDEKDTSSCREFDTPPKNSR